MNTLKNADEQQTSSHQDVRIVTRFIISGDGIYNKNPPTYSTAKDAHDDLLKYARRRGQSWLAFNVYEIQTDGLLKLA
jgi:hypothetical protein